MKEFVSKYNLPAYKGSGRGFEHEQIEGRDPILEVEAIQGKVGRANKTRYLVKWKGHIERTLEPKSHLKGCMDLVQQYEDSPIALTRLGQVVRRRGPLPVLH